jgi:hypothetical protein
MVFDPEFRDMVQEYGNGLPGRKPRPSGSVQTLRYWPSPHNDADSGREHLAIDLGHRRVVERQPVPQPRAIAFPSDVG